jgi:plasmid stabilization system protein ParE
MAEVRWTSQALDDIENIAEFIANDSPRYARYAGIQVSVFFDSVLCLQEFPKTGRIVPEAGDKNIRELIVGFNKIVIPTIHHTKRRLTKKKIRKLK